MDLTFKVGPDLSPSMDEDSAFEIPVRPVLSYDGERVTRRGGTTFELVPIEPASIGDLDAVVRDLLRRSGYVVGDWFELPRPVYLVHDPERSSTFRVVVEDGRIELRVLPSTTSESLETFYERLREATGMEWDAMRRVEDP